MDVGRFRQFPDREFRFAIGDGMIFISPEVVELFFGRVFEVDYDAQYHFGVSLRNLLLSNRSLIEVFRLFSLTTAGTAAESMERKLPEIWLSPMSRLTRLILMVSRRPLGIPSRRRRVFPPGYRGFCLVGGRRLWSGRSYLSGLRPDRTGWAVVLGFCR